MRTFIIFGCIIIAEAINYVQVSNETGIHCLVVIMALIMDITEFILKIRNQK